MSNEGDGVRWTDMPQVAQGVAEVALKGVCASAAGADLESEKVLVHFKRRYPLYLSAVTAMLLVAMEDFYTATRGGPPS